MAFGLESLIGPVIGYLGKSIFGGGAKAETSNQDRLLGQMEEIFAEQMRNYQNANLEQQDAKTLAITKSILDKTTKQNLEEFDAKYGQGFDTEKTRRQAMIAKDGADDLASLAAQLESSRLQRKMSLLPGQGAIAPGVGLAASIDNANANANNANSLAWAAVGDALGRSLQKKEATPGASIPDPITGMPKLNLPIPTDYSDMWLSKEGKKNIPKAVQ